MGAEDLLPLEVVRNDRSRLETALTGLESFFQLVQDHFFLFQDQPDIRMGNEISRSGNRIGVSCLADFSDRYYVPNISEAELSFKDTYDVASRVLDGDGD